MASTIILKLVNNLLQSFAFPLWRFPWHLYLDVLFGKLSRVSYVIPATEGSESPRRLIVNARKSIGFRSENMYVRTGRPGFLRNGPSYSV